MLRWVKLCCIHRSIVSRESEPFPPYIWQSTEAPSKNYCLRRDQDEGRRKAQALDISCTSCTTYFDAAYLSLVDGICGRTFRAYTFALSDHTYWCRYFARLNVSADGEYFQRSKDQVKSTDVCMCMCIYEPTQSNMCFEVIWLKTCYNVI